jgi:hypothetical protein
MPFSEEPHAGAIKPRDSLVLARRARSHQAVLQRACPGQGAVLAGVLLASPSTLGPAGWWPMGPGRTTRPGPGGPLCATRPEPFTGPGWLPFGPADLASPADVAFRCSLLIVLAYRDPACAEQNTSLP